MLVPRAAAPHRAPAAVDAAPDLILHNARILTLDGAGRTAQAVAIRRGRIAAIGSTADAMRLRGARTRLEDLGERMVTPGLTDGHAHLDREGLKSVYPALGPVRSIADIQDRIADLARRAPPGAWIVTMPIGTPPEYLDNRPDALAEGRWPTRHDLDRPAGGRPVLIRCVWGFWTTRLPIVSCANSRALALAGIDRTTRPPLPMIRLETDAAGDPTGVIVESEYQPLAELLWFRAATRLSPADRMRTLPASAAAYHACGTTAVVEAHGVADEALHAWRAADAAGRIHMRAVLPASHVWSDADLADIDGAVRTIAARQARSASGRLSTAGLYVQFQKRPSDVLRSSFAPNTGWAGFNYATGVTPEAFRPIALACARHDVRLFINFGLAAKALDVLEAVNREVPLRDRRWVLSHVTDATPREIDQIARLGLGVGAHLNPSIYKNGDAMLTGRLANRPNEIAPMRQLIDAGIPVGLETDNVPVSLFWPIWEAVARTSIGGRPVAPGQAIAVTEALRCAAWGGAWLAGDEAERGTLEVGKAADLVVLDRDVLAAGEGAGVGLRETRAVRVMVAGRWVYERG